MATNPAFSSRAYAAPILADAEVARLLEDLGHAVTAGDARAAAELWAIPAMVLGDQDVRAVSSREELARFFGNARAEYNAQGITGTRPDVRNLTWLTRELALVEVRWPYLTEDRHEKGEETSTYVLRRDESGVLKIQVALLHGSTT
ncbi:MAG TPA: hypothetical protein VJU15_03495 [Gemmatimonadales bacterium]|nr:hypothetical protein [Gemmatimonadales bacterium]